MMLAVLAILGGLALGQANLQVPPEIKAQVLSIGDRFTNVLEQECLPSMCYPVGCQVGRFETLDQQQTSSLPGLDEPPPAGKPQYKLIAVLCEFSHEASLPAADLANLRQRLQQKVREAGVTVSVSARALAPKAEPAPTATPEPVYATWEESLWFTLLPFLPWLVIALFATIISLVFIWGFRRLGRPKPVRPIELTANAVGPAAMASPAMILSRIKQLGDELLSDTTLVEQSLKKAFDEHNIDELGLYLRHFGPKLLEPLKGKLQYKDTLGALSSAFQERQFTDEPKETWAFLDRVEKSVVAAKIRIDQQPIEEEFGFLVAVTPDELVGLLRELSEDDAVATIAYAPRALREAFFAMAPPSFTAKFIEQLTRVDRLPDAAVREAARKVRAVHEEKGGIYRQNRVDRMPLLEQALNALEPEKRREIFAGLGKQNPSFLKAIAPAVFMDDSLPFFTDDMLTEIFLAVSPREAAAYLSGQTWGKEVLDRLKPRLRQTIDTYAGLSEEQVTALSASARERIAEYVRERDRAGQLNLSEINAAFIDGDRHVGKRG